MANQVVIKNKATADSAPATSDLIAGELALNTNDGKLYYENSGGNIKYFGDSADSLTAASADATALAIALG